VKDTVCHAPCFLQDLFEVPSLYFSANTETAIFHTSVEDVPVGNL